MRGLNLTKLGYAVGDRQMAEILGLDVSTVAGRSELLEHDVNVERVRKAGAGTQSCRKKTPEVYRGDRRTYEVRGRKRSRQRSRWTRKTTKK